jgi:hypothetical protein
MAENLSGLPHKNRVIGGHITNGEYGSKNLPLVD